MSESVDILDTEVLDGRAFECLDEIGGRPEIPRRVSSIAGSDPCLQDGQRRPHPDHGNVRARHRFDDMPEQTSRLEHPAEKQAASSSCSEVRPHASQVAMDEPLVPRIVVGNRPTRTDSREIDERVGHARVAKKPRRFAGDSRFARRGSARKEKHGNGFACVGRGLGGGHDESVACRTTRPQVTRHSGSHQGRTAIANAVTGGQRGHRSSAPLCGIRVRDSNRGVPRNKGVRGASWPSLSGRVLVR